MCSSARDNAKPRYTCAMFELSISSEFCAAHALTIKGALEPVHGHNFHVNVVVAGPGLDTDGLLCDFHDVERALKEIIEPLNNKNLSDTEPFKSLNPSAENIARYIADRLSTLLGPALGCAARVRSVRVTEAPGCAATYTVGS